MTTLARSVSLYIDGNKSGGLNAALDGTLSSPPPNPTSLMAGDRCPVALYFRARATDDGASTVLELPAGSTVVMAGRMATGALLFASTGFTAGSTCYTGTIDLGTAAIEAALAGTAYGASVTIYLDIEVRDAANLERLTFRIVASLYKQVYGDVSALPAVNLLSPSGYSWALTIDDDGNMAQTRQADPDPLVAGASYFEIQSPSGYTWQIAIADDGTLTKTRLS
jgi:hypothetical protein